MGLTDKETRETIENLVTVTHIWTLDNSQNGHFLLAGKGRTFLKMRTIGYLNRNT